MLQRMADPKLKLIDQLSKPHKNLQDMWALHKRPPILGLEYENYQHEQMCADVYIALKLTGENQEWTANKAKHRIIEEDRKSIFLNRPVYWEIDRGTEKKPGVIESKANRYIKLSREFKEKGFDGMFYVIFVVEDFERQLYILKRLPENRGSQFLVTSLKDFSQHPCGDAYVLASRKTELVYLQDLQ